MPAAINPEAAHQSVVTPSRRLPRLGEQTSRAAGGDTAADQFILTLNCGSSSVKAAIFDATPERRRRWAGVVERIGQDNAGARLSIGVNGIAAASDRRFPDHAAALDFLLKAATLGSPKGKFAAVGHRIVYGGDAFTGPASIDDGVVAQIEQLAPFAPQHIPKSLKGVVAARSALPESLHVACFDTTFHDDLPQLARLIALPRRYFNVGVRRYGFHGLSYESVVEALKEAGADLANERIVIAHLGAGASMCAVKDGRSIDTTMGFSTLSGLPMGSRSGDVDPGALLFLLTREGLDAAQLQHLLYEESGLLGLSGVSGDMRELLAMQTNPEAAEAVDFFCWQARRHLVALTASLGGLDRLVFTGGIGANSSIVRARICDGLEYLGVSLDIHRNVIGSQMISVPEARVTIEALDADEERMIAGHVWRALN